jgi:hypothetical protein
MCLYLFCLNSDAADRFFNQIINRCRIQRLSTVLAHVRDRCVFRWQSVRADGDGSLEGRDKAALARAWLGSTMTGRWVFVSESIRRTDPGISRLVSRT